MAPPFRHKETAERVTPTRAAKAMSVCGLHISRALSKSKSFAVMSSFA